MAASIVQGSTGFPVLLPAAYNYICTGQYLDQVKEDSDVPDPFIRTLLNEVSILPLILAM